MAFVLCSGDPDLVCVHVQSPCGVRGGVPNLGPGVGMVHDCLLPALDPSHRCVQTVASRGQPLGGVCLCYVVMGVKGFLLLK